MDDTAELMIAIEHQDLKDLAARDNRSMEPTKLPSAATGST